MCLGTNAVSTATALTPGPTLALNAIVISNLLGFLDSAEPL